MQKPQISHDRLCKTDTTTTKKTTEEAVGKVRNVQASINRELSCISEKRVGA